MKKLFICTIGLFFGLALFSQTNAIKYDYDLAGNRIERHVIVLSKDSTNQKSSEEFIGKEEIFNDKLGEQEIIIFPNPTKGMLTVAISNLKATESARMEVYSLKGEQVFINSKIRNNTKVDLSKQKPGTYVLKILLDDEVSTWKIVKE